MSIIYNTQGNIANNLVDFFNSIHPLRKSQQKVLPYILLGMLESESVVTHDIIKKLKGNFSFVKNESNQKRLRRFFNNNLFDIYTLYDSVIKHIINNYHPKHSDNRIHISFDHSFCKDEFTILSFSMRIGKQGIPLWFKCFKDIRDNDAFTEELIIEGINYIHNLFANLDFDLIFLADRWFNSVDVMKHIDSLGHKFVIRAKTNIKFLVHDPKEGHKVWYFLSDIKPYVYKSKIFENITFSYGKPTVFNLVISKSNGADDPWYLITNADPKRAIKDYAYRFGSIETIFKNQKSNGFYLESTNVRNIKAFTTMFGLANIAIIWMVILGADYSKNKHHRDNLIIDVKYYKNCPRRIISLFNLGLTWFNLLINSEVNKILKCNFILYDI